MSKLGAFDAYVQDEQEKAWKKAYQEYCIKHSGGVLFSLEDWLDEKYQREIIN